MVQCSMTFNAPDKIYHPGDTLRLQINLVLKKPKEIQSMHVHILGRGYCKWRAHRNDHKDEEHYLDSDTILFDSESNENAELAAGEHVYNVECVLPEGLPSSVVYDKKHGFIRYTAQVIIKDLRYKLTEEFQVLRKEYDLNLEPELAKPLEIDEICQINGCCCWQSCWSKKPIMFKISIPRTGYVPGENIPIDIHVDNRTEVPIQDFKITLCKNILYRYSKKGIDLHLKKVEDLVTTLCKRPMPGIGVLNFVHLLEVPQLPPSSIPVARTASHHYSIMVEVLTDGICYEELDFGFGITIGTIPINTTVV